MLRRRSDLVAVTAALALVCAGLLGGCTGTARGETSGSSATASARQFLHRYVSSSGAVVRHDQGGDTVSEGQGYAMLLAYAVNDRSLFTKIWRWTSRHLRQPSGLFAYHWQNGSVADTQPAADADTQIAWALDLAGRRWSITADTTAARRIAGAIAANEIGYDENGRPTLAAGPWAVGAGQPVQVEPGYWTFPADAALAVLTNDNRWRDLAAADAAHLKALTRNGATLPPDWATIGSGSEAVVVTTGGKVVRWLPVPEEPPLPTLPLAEVPKSGHLAGPALQQARVLGAVPAALRPYVERSYYGESGVDVVLTSGIELRFGDASQAALKWKAAAAVLADPSTTALDYVDLHAPNRPAVRGSGHTLPPAP